MSIRTRTFIVSTTDLNHIDQTPRSDLADVFQNTTLLQLAGIPRVVRCIGFHADDEILGHCTRCPDCFNDFPEETEEIPIRRILAHPTVSLTVSE